jgi:hypothetical protein
MKAHSAERRKLRSDSSRVRRIVEAAVRRTGHAAVHIYDGVRAPARHENDHCTD